jgi:hypothetical protein
VLKEGEERVEREEGEGRGKSKMGGRLYGMGAENAHE